LILKMCKEVGYRWRDRPQSARPVMIGKSLPTWQGEFAQRKGAFVAQASCP
jgi:hypothetical protein